jgi:hypothetical protein
MTGISSADSTNDASKRLQYGLIVAFDRSKKPAQIRPWKAPAGFLTGFPAAKTPCARGELTQSWSHRLVIGTAAALRRNPGDIAVGILDVAGLAVDAILSVDLEPGA